MGWLAVGFLAWLGGWAINIRLATLPKSRLTGLAIPMIFGLSLVVIWESMVRGFDVSPILLPAPSVISVKFAGSLGILWQDFVQTVVKGALSGYAIGCGSAFALAVVIDRFPFLQRGLLPIGNFVAALPIIGMAPILVMWFGFDWHSKAAVVVVMIFFPILVNTVQGLAASDAMQRDLMRTYAASKFQARRPVLNAAAMTLDECVYECDRWKVPGRVKVAPDGQYHKILQFDYRAEPKIEKLAHQMTREEIDEWEDIPF